MCVRSFAIGTDTHAFQSLLLAVSGDHWYQLYVNGYQWLQMSFLALAANLAENLERSQNYQRNCRHFQDDNQWKGWANERKWRILSFNGTNNWFSKL